MPIGAGSNNALSRLMDSNLQCGFRPTPDRPFTLLESPSGNLRNVLAGEGPQDSQPFTSLLWTPTPCTTACCIWGACIKIPASNDSGGAILGSLNIAPVLRRVLSKLQSRCRAHDRSSKRPCQFCAVAISRSTSVLLAPAFWQPANICERPAAPIDRVASAAVRSQEPPVAGAAVARREPRLAHSNVLSIRLLAKGWLASRGMAYGWKRSVRACCASDSRLCPSGRKASKTSAARSAPASDQGA